MPHPVGQGGGGPPPPPKRRQRPEPPPPPPPPPPGWINQRAGLIHPQLAQQFPDLGLSLLHSGIPDFRIAAVSNGIWNLIASNKLNLHMPDLGGSGELVGKAAGWNPQSLSPVPPAPVVVPNQIQSKVNGLFPKYRSVGAWLAHNTQAAPAFGWHEPPRLGKDVDPDQLSNLILYSKTIDGKVTVVMRSSVLDMLQGGESGTPATRLMPTGAPSKLGLSGEAAYRKKAEGPDPTDPNYIRAKTIMGIVLKLYPDANIEFQSGGIFGKAMAGVTSVENLAAPVVAEALHMFGPGKHQAPTREIVNGKIVTVQADPDRLVQPSWGDLYRQSLGSSDLQFGPEAAQRIGMKPSDPEYKAWTGFVNFVSDWYLNPLIVGGKFGEGLRLASRVPNEIGSLKGLAGLVYNNRARNVVDLVTDTSQGQRVTQDIFHEITRDPESAADRLTRTFGFTPNQAAIMATSRTPTDVAENLVRHFKGLTKEDVSKLMGRKNFLEEQIANLTKQRREGDRGGLVSDMPGDSMANARAELLDVENQLRFNPARADYDPLRELPKMKATSAFYRTVADTFEDGSKMKAWFERHILEPSDLGIPGTRVNLKRIFQPIATMRPLRNPYSPNAIRGDMTLLRDNVEAMMADYGVPVEARAKVLSSLVKQTTQQGVYDVMTHDVSRTVQEAIKGLPAGVRNDMEQYFKDSFLGKQWGVLDKPGETRVGMPKADWEPLFSYTKSMGEGGLPDEVAQPFLRTHLADEFMLPGHEGILDITGAWRKVLRKIPWRNHKTMLDAWHTEQKVLDRITRGWKNFILLGRPGAVLLRTTGEESFRAAAAHMASPVNRPWEWIKSMVSNDMRMWDEYRIADAGRRGEAADIRAQIADLPWYDLKERNALRKKFNLAVRDDLATNLGFIHNFNLRDIVTAPEGGRVISLRDSNQAIQDQGWRALRSWHYSWNRDELAREVLKSDNTGEVMNWFRSADGQEYVHDMKELWNGYDVPKAVRDAEAKEGRLEINGVSEARLKWFADSLRESMDHMTGKHSGVKQAILDGGIYGPEGQMIQELLDRLQESRNLYREYETLSTRLETMPDAMTALERSRAMEGSAKDALGVLHIHARELADMGDNLVLPEQLAGKHFHPITSQGYADVLRGMRNSGAWVDAPNFISGAVRDAPLAAGKMERVGFINRMYELTLSGPEGYLMRKPLFRQAAERRYKELRSFGWDRKAAQRIAARDAADETRKLLYDLSERTSAQHFARHLAPFLPAWQEILTTWAWELPKQYYPIIGQGFLLARAGQVQELMKAIGVDPSALHTFGPLGWVLNQTLGGPEYKARFNPRSFNLVSQSIMPALGPVHAVTLSAIAKRFPVLQPIAKKMMPYGLDVQLGPMTLNMLWEGIAHRPPPWELASLESQDTRYAYAKFDAMRHARVQLGEEGILPPEEKDFINVPGGINKYHQAQSKYVRELTDKANHNLTWWYIYRSLAATFFPAPLTVSDSYKDDISKFYADTAGMSASSPEAEQAWNRWLEDHPYGDFYRTPGTIVTKQIPQQKFAKYQDSYSRTAAEIQQGYRRQLSPEEFAALGMGFTARNVYNNQLQHALDDIGTNSPAQLENWYKRSNLINQYRTDWDNYLKFNKPFADIYGNMSQQGHPEAWVNYSNSLDHLVDFYKAGKELLTFDTPNQVSRADLRTLLGQMGASIAKANTYSGGRLSGINWWFNNVLDPYSTHVSKLFNEANRWKQLESPSRPDAYVQFAHTMEQIREYKVAQENRVGPDGLKYPTPERFYWGNLPPVAEHAGDPDQQSKITDWLTLKPEWLTPFELKHSGLLRGNGKAMNEMSSFIASYDARMNTFISAHNVSFASNEYDNLKARRQTDLTKAAVQFGPAAVHLWKLSNTTASERMLAAGWAKPESLFGRSVLLSDIIKTRITKAGYSYKSDSEMATTLKGQFYSILDQWYRDNPKFQADINHIQGVLGKDPDNPAPRYATYAAIFFDDFGGL